MGNLRPEKRADKNGKVSTKWVRDSAGSDKASALPAPAPVAVSDAVWNDIRASQVNGILQTSRLWDKTEYKTEDFDPRALLALESMLRTAPRGFGRRASDSVMRAFKHMYNNLSDSPSMSQEELFLPVNNLAVFGRLMLREDVEVLDVTSYINGLERQFGPKRDFLNDVSEKERAMAVALVTVATRLDLDYSVDAGYLEWNAGEKISENSTRIASAELAEFIMQNVDDAEAIAKIIIDRDTDDVEIIAGVLKHEQRALRDGVL